MWRAWLCAGLWAACGAGAGAGGAPRPLGCYALEAGASGTHDPRARGPAPACLALCEPLYYRYALLLPDTSCRCVDLPPARRLPAVACAPAAATAPAPAIAPAAATVYRTAVTSPGPPAELRALSATEGSARVRWAPPPARATLTGYAVRAACVLAYADPLPPPLLYALDNATLRVELLGLQPGAVYDVTVAAEDGDERGPPASLRLETEIGTPDPAPPDAIVKEHRGDKIAIGIPRATNVNGPVTFYRVVVSIEISQTGYIPENLNDYNTATEEGLPYYITAELDPKDIEHDFIVGDGKTYNNYYNAPLPLTNDIDISIGVVSEKNNIRKLRYADAKKIIVININEMEEVSGLVVALGAAIAIGVVLLLIGIGLVIILRKKVQMARLQRCSQSMPLSMSEPCVEIENSGFFPEEDVRVDHYGNLKRKLWNIPRNLIDFDISCVAGMGSYGKFTRGKVQQHGAQTPSLIQIIADHELERPERKLMLQELDILIKTSEHENVISLIGICETPAALFVVLQDSRETLKELLVSCRHRDLQNNKFSLITEARVMQVCLDVARGMEYLHSKKIYHKKLCCRNIVMADGGVPKVTGFGLSHIHPLNETPDYTRWTAQEMLQQTRFNPKADVWSYGCLLWEIFTLGATPYPQAPNKDVSTRVLRGMRPPQPSYVGDELFQVCLQCWQIDMDERPTFTTLTRELALFTSNAITGNLSFTHDNHFSYEPYMPALEILS